ncbi:MAG: SdrD B-like domain-containing protein, partial [Planctomycetota bacterium]
MGLFSTLLGAARPDRRPRTLAKAPRRGGVERCEPREMLAADVLLGSVYYEEATGDDSAPDVLQVSFVGGADGTTLDRLVIDGDKLGDGLGTGDVFFDTEPTDPGVFGAVGLTIVETDGFTVTGAEVLDGGTSIAFTFDGFDAGEELVFSIDVDEVSFASGDEVDVTAVAEGGEFQRSHLRGEFSAPGFVDLPLSAQYWDSFDADFDAAEAATGGELTRLPSDVYEFPTEQPDRTAGAVAHAPQVELARLSGYVYHDRDDDGLKEAGEEGIAGVTLELLDTAGSVHATTTTGADGFYEFRNLEKGAWSVREAQPAGWLDGKDTPGSTDGGVSPNGVATNDFIGGVVLDYFDVGENYNFGELLAGSIAGRVHASDGPDCDYENPDELLEGVVVELLSPAGVV